ncbi:hypothetical protein WDW89_05990 [Deltaproteobacteria bacterium TL4]
MPKLRIMALFLVFWVPSALSASDLSFEMGINRSSQQPTGTYVEDFDTVLSSFGGRFAVKYLFDSGFVVGRESFSSAFPVLDNGVEAILVITNGGFTVGWGFGDSLRLLFEAGIPEEGLVTLRADMMVLEVQEFHLGGSQTWYGLSFDWGDAPLGWIMTIRQVYYHVDNAFDSGQTLEMEGVSYGLGIRLRM